MQRTRIKICGLTREEDVQAAVAAGADAVGFVFYEKSPRYVSPQRAAELIALLPPFVTAVGLFVNHSAGQVAATVAQAPLALLQFHGDETAAQCAAAAQAAGRPFLRVFRVKPDTTGSELLAFEAECRAASRLFSGVLLDTYVDAYGGAGKSFDWSVIPPELARRAVLSGGLTVDSVAGAVASVRPYAVDVSSGVERAKGIKDEQLIRQFIAAVR